MRRFERIHDVVEPVEAYRRGGYHPVHLHDIFNQRYEVIGKLAYGQFSTVWLANDQLLQRQVALKIVKAENSKNNKELSTLLHLSASGLDHPGKAHVIELLDHFEHDGPNGTHLCLVLPVMLSDGTAMTVTGKPHQAAYVQAIASQVSLGLDFIHALGLIHCDLQPGNVMLSVVGTRQIESSLQSPEFSPVKWLEGVEVDESAPEYLMVSQRRRGYLDGADFSKLIIKIGDLGRVALNGQSNSWPVTPTAYRAPELIYRKTWDASIDIWALGCLIYEFATNEPLFPIGTFGLTAEQIDEEHVYLIDQVLNQDRHMNEDLIDYLTERLPSDFGAENIQHLTFSLSLMLQKDPQKRMPTTKLLNQPFLTGKV